MVDQSGLVTEGFGWLLVNEQTTLWGICCGGNRPHGMKIIFLCRALRRMYFKSDYWLRMEELMELGQAGINIRGMHVVSILGRFYQLI